MRLKRTESTAPPPELSLFRTVLASPPLTFFTFASRLLPIGSQQRTDFGLRELEKGITEEQSQGNPPPSHRRDGVVKVSRAHVAWWVVLLSYPSHTSRAYSVFGRLISPQLTSSRAPSYGVTQSYICVVMSTAHAADSTLMR